MKNHKKDDEGLVKQPRIKKEINNEKMIIYRSDDGKKVIIEIPYWQSINNCYDLDADNKFTSNIIGIIAGDEMTLSQLIDLSYKGDQQEGSPLVCFYGDKQEFIAICKDLDIDIWEHPICNYCYKAIRGSFILGDKGNKCFDCEYKYVSK